LRITTSRQQQYRLRLLGKVENIVMTTRLEGPLKRELVIKGEPYTLTISPLNLVLARKGRRKGYELAWESFVNGEAALATALNASLAKAPKTA
jgi:hypothetical protein